MLQKFLQTDIEISTYADRKFKKCKLIYRHGSTSTRIQWFIVLFIKATNAAEEVLSANRLLNSVPYDTLPILFCLKISHSKTASYGLDDTSVCKTAHATDRCLSIVGCGHTKMKLRHNALSHKDVISVPMALCVTAVFIISYKEVISI